MISTDPAGLTLTVALAFGRHVFAPAETTMLNSCVSVSDASIGEVEERRPTAAVNARDTNCFFIRLSPVRFVRRSSVLPVFMNCGRQDWKPGALYGSRVHSLPRA